MAQKSKTQRAKASAARAARKEARELESQQGSAAAAEDSSKKTKSFSEKVGDVVSAKGPQKTVKKESASKPAQSSSTSVKKKSTTKVKKERFKFFKEVRSEMKRVTWPTKPEVIRWSLVVVAALIFFGVYVALLDNAIVTPLLVLISSLGA